MKYGLFDNQLKTVEKILCSYPEIEEAVLFGSRAIGTFKEASDVDIALKGKKAGHKLTVDLKCYFEEKTNLPYFFDFISYPYINNKNLKEHIDKHGIVIYRKGWRKVKLGDVITMNPSEKILKGNIAKKILMDDLVSFKKTISNYTNKIYKGGSKFRNGDTIVARITPCLENGKTAFVNILDKNEVGFGSTEFIVLRNKPHLTDEHFLFYFAISTYFRDSSIQSMTGSSGRQRVQENEVKNLEIFLPPLREQEVIAEVLSSLDDKIELLHEQNKTLENIAQTLFRKWFIEDVKDDWEEKPLDKIADYLNGLACQKYPPKNEFDKLPVLKIKELRNGFTKNSDWSTSEIEDKYIIKLGDIIFSWSGSLLIKIWDGQKCVLNQHLFKITSKQYPRWFYYFWTKYYMEKFIGIANSKATTMGHIKREDLSSSIGFIPSKNELSKMNKLINPQFKKIISNLKSISKLEKLRNTLLPKFMNGKIKIKCLD